MPEVEVVFQDRDGYGVTWGFRDGLQPRPGEVLEFTDPDAAYPTAIVLARPRPTYTVTERGCRALRIHVRQPCEDEL